MLCCVSVVGGATRLPHVEQEPMMSLTCSIIAGCREDGGASTLLAPDDSLGGADGGRAGGGGIPCRGRALEGRHVGVCLVG